MRAKKVITTILEILIIIPLAFIWSLISLAKKS